MSTSSITINVAAGATLHLHLVDAEDLADIKSQLATLISQGATEMASISDVNAALLTLAVSVQADTDAVSAGTTLIQQLSAQQALLNQELKDALAANDPVAIQAAVDKISAFNATVANNAANLAAAVAAGTPATPPAPAPPVIDPVTPPTPPDVAGS